jgi:hypothetical protein
MSKTPPGGDDDDKIRRKEKAMLKCVRDYYDSLTDEELKRQMAERNVDETMISIHQLRFSLVFGKACLVFGAPAAQLLMNKIIVEERGKAIRKIIKQATEQRVDDCEENKKNEDIRPRC